MIVEGAKRMAPVKSWPGALIAFLEKKVTPGVSVTMKIRAR